MKIKVRQVTTIPVTYVEEDNVYYFAWIASCYKDGQFSGWHVAVF